MRGEHRAPFGESRQDEREIWSMLVLRDSEAFISCDWNRVADDFIADGFHGIDAGGSADPVRWTVRFSSLEAYRNEWSAQARAISQSADASLALSSLLSATTLDRIEINGDFAIAHKKFDGSIQNRDGTRTKLRWQTIYVVRRSAGKWKIASFVGYLPLGAQIEHALYVAAGKQHKTAGPYSPAIGVRAGSDIIVISGQAPLDDDGRVIGETIQEQAHVVLGNCGRQLAAAGLTFADVFKATVFMTDLQNWADFNEVYRNYMREPFPARTAIETGLLPGMLVEIEMWAAKR